MSAAEEILEQIDITTHEHTVSDTDKTFTVDIFNRKIIADSGQKTILIQGDHKSEIFTFTLPRYIEGHDMAACNTIYIPYINTEVESRNPRFKSGVYTVSNITVNKDTVVFTWEISINATSLEGVLHFMLLFSCMEGSRVEYRWNTDYYEDVIVKKSLYSELNFETEYLDIIEQWKETVKKIFKEYIDSEVDSHIAVVRAELEASMKADFEAYSDEVDEKFEQKSNEVDETLESFDDILRREISEMDNQIDVLKSRMDTFASLEEGSTTGDAELADIRVDAYGNTHDSAGAAVRDQIKKLQNEHAYGNVFLNKDYTFTFVQGEYIELTLNGNSEIFCNGTVYTVTDVHAKYVIEGSSSLFTVIFNYKTSSISIQYFRNDIPENSVIIGTIYQSVLKLNSYGRHIWNTTGIDSHTPENMPVWCNDIPTVVIDNIDGVYKLTLHMPYCVTSIGYAKFAINARTVEFETSVFGVCNILYNRLTDDLIIEHRGASIRDNYFQIGCIAMVSESVYMNNSVYFQSVNNLALAPLILGFGNKFVEFDSINKTVTFPDDTLVLNNKSNTNKKYYQLTNAAGNSSVSYAEYSSSAIVIYFDTFDNSLKAGTYLSALSNKHIVIASMRVNNGQVSINAPYKMDGKPFNMELGDFGVELPSEVDFKRDFIVKSVNHRGYCTKAPENTLSAYKLSAKHGFDYVECDVSFTSDNVPVLLHDSTIDRTSNGTGNINNLTFEEVRKYDFGSWFSSDYTGELIPTFEEFIALCRKLSLHPYIEIKSSAAYTQEQINALINIVQRYGMTDNVSYISFNYIYLEYVKKADNKARLGYVVGDVTNSVISTAKTLKNTTNEVFIDANYGSINTDSIYRCINAGFPLEVWTLNNADYICNQLDSYITGVTSDNVHAGKVLFKAGL